MYAGFPKACCTSVNNIVAHGIPDECVHWFARKSSISDIVRDISRPLQSGDIVNVDVTIYLDGFHGDTSQTFLVGDVVRFYCRIHHPAAISHSQESRIPLEGIW